MAIPTEFCIAASRLFTSFQPVILKLPRVSLYNTLLRTTRTRCGVSEELSWASKSSETTLPKLRRTERALGGARAGTHRWVLVPLPRPSPLPGPASNVLLRFATLRCNLSIIRRKKPTLYLILICVVWLKILIAGGLE